MIKRKNTVEHTELIKSFSEKFKTSWNDACDEIGDIDFQGEHDFYGVEEMKALLELPGHSASLSLPTIQQITGFSKIPCCLSKNVSGR